MQTTNPHMNTLTSVVRLSWRLSRRARHLPLTSRRASALAPLAFAGLLLLTAASLTAGHPSDAPHAQAPAASSLSSAVVLVADADQRAQGGALRYRRGYSVQSGWLCYGWSSGAYHCTRHWRGTAGHYVSLNQPWVPSEAGEVRTTATTFSASWSAPAHISQWAYTGRASYMEPMGGTQGYSWGWCTAGAAQFAHDYVGGLGNADQWARNAAARGMATGYTPRVGATVVYAPGVQGAGSGGHVAHVAAVYGNGWFLSQDSNFFWNGGGWGRVSFRYAHAGAGVSFIY